MNWQDSVESHLRPLLAAARLGLVTDVDGTISPIAQRPEAAHVTPRSRELLAALQARLPLVAVISGRAAADVQKRVGVPGLVYVGNHGLERWAGGGVQVMPAAAPYRRGLEAVLRALEPYEQQINGLLVEDKGATLSIHYRQTPNPGIIATALDTVIKGAAFAQGLKVFPGRMIFEVRPPVEVDKGTAFASLVHEYRLDAAVYLGDDVTDVDAFRAAQALRSAGDCYALALGVLSDGDPAGTPPLVRDAADLLLAGVPDVEAFLAWLLDSV